MAFVPRLSDAGMRGNRWWYSSGNPYYPGFPLPNCVCYAYGRYAEIRNGFANLPSGNAGDWWDDVTTDFRTGQTPALGAVMCYHDKRPSYQSTYRGHVCVVEEINDDGSLVTSNSGWDGPYFWTSTVYRTLNDRNYLQSWMRSGGREYVFQGFIYNDAVTNRISTPYVVAAICGCWVMESGLNPAMWSSNTVPPSTPPWDYIYNNGVGAYGLGQWKNANSSDMRLQRLANYLQYNSYAQTSGDGQMSFFVYENHWTPTLHYQNLTEFLDSTSVSVDDLVMDFLEGWLNKPGDAYYQRVNAANVFLDYISSHLHDDPNSYEWIYNLNRNLLDSEIKNNVMCIFFWLTHGLPVPPPFIPRKNMPIWMYIKRPKIITIPSY